MSIKENRFKEDGSVNMNNFSLQNISVGAVIGIVVGIIMIISSFVVIDENYINGLRALGAVVIGTSGIRLLISAMNTVKATMFFIIGLIILLVLISIL